jgi:hypothetical protein
VTRIAGALAEDGRLHLRDDSVLLDTKPERPFGCGSVGAYEEVPRTVGHDRALRAHPVDEANGGTRKDLFTSRRCEDGPGEEECALGGARAAMADTASLPWAVERSRRNAGILGAELLDGTLMNRICTACRRKDRRQQRKHDLGSERNGDSHGVESISAGSSCALQGILAVESARRRIVDQCKPLREDEGGGRDDPPRLPRLGTAL